MKSKKCVTVQENTLNMKKTHDVGGCTPRKDSHANENGLDGARAVHHNQDQQHSECSQFSLAGAVKV